MLLIVNPSVRQDLNHFVLVHDTVISFFTSEKAHYFPGLHQAKISVIEFLTVEKELAFDV